MTTAERGAAKCAISETKAFEQRSAIPLWGAQRVGSGMWSMA